MTENHCLKEFCIEWIGFLVRETLMSMHPSSTLKIKILRRYVLARHLLPERADVKQMTQCEVNFSLRIHENHGICVSTNQNTAQ